MKKMVREFQLAMGSPMGLRLTPDNLQQFELNQELIKEEADELLKELHTVHGRLKSGIVLSKQDKIALYKELADLLYVIMHFCNTFNVSIEKIFAEVHRSNMSKLDDEGKPIRNEYGKVIKGPNYRPPDFSRYVK